MERSRSVSYTHLDVYKRQVLKTIKVVHLIIGLGKGGAETMLYNVIKFKQNTNVHHTVVSLGVGDDYYFKKLINLGETVRVLNIRRRPFRTFVELCNLLKATDIILSLIHI